MNILSYIQDFSFKYGKQLVYYICLYKINYYFKFKIKKNLKSCYF